MQQNEIKKERAVLICVDSGEYDAEISINELAQLAQTAGAEIVGEIIQTRKCPDGAAYIGKGKLRELKEFCDVNEVDMIIADCDLTSTQQRNLEKETGLRVIDRTTLILDIFAQRARSGEGKLQVELAQLQYLLPRLAGRGTSMSRLGGGIGTRGPGETKLESDRRHIRRRISALKDELRQLEARRERLRGRRKKNGVITVALVGYTNAGKSTLMNTLTNAGVLAEDKLFATLDPTARALKLTNGETVMLIDTVGFIRRLPHGLIEAFKSTLDEAVNADIILNICDASSDECEEHLKITNELLKELGCTDKPVISVFNKSDLATQDYLRFTDGVSVSISALTGKRIDELLEKITAALPTKYHKASLLLPFSMAGEVAQLRENGVVHHEEYTEKGILCEVTAEISKLEKLRDYFC
ncbi:MAG: GTPase HflX [Acutalibacteraceae bacterium]